MLGVACFCLCCVVASLFFGVVQICCFWFWAFEFRAQGIGVAAGLQARPSGLQYTYSLHRSSFFG